MGAHVGQSVNIPGVSISKTLVVSFAFKKVFTLWCASRDQARQPLLEIFPWPTQCHNSQWTRSHSEYTHRTHFTWGTYTRLTFLNVPSLFFFGNLGLKMLKLLKELEIVCSVGGKGDLPVKSVGGRWVPYIWDIWERLGIRGYTLAFWISCISSCPFDDVMQVAFNCMPHIRHNHQNRCVSAKGFYTQSFILHTYYTFTHNV